jgi:DNA-binding response OmpR family regulator
VVVSGRTRGGDRERIRKLGADGFLPKPFGVDELEQAVVEAARVGVGTAS